MVRRRAFTVAAATALVVLGVSTPAFAAGPGIGDVSDAMRYGPSAPLGTPLGDLSGQDDEVTTVAAPFPINFFGVVSNGLCITTNGGFYPVPTSGDSCSDSYDYDLENLALDSSASMIAALGADLDPGECDDPTPDGFGIPCEIYFEPSTTVDGRAAFAITWYRVPMNDTTNLPASLSATFQIVIIKRATGSDAAGWDFDIEFNFGTATDAEDGYSAASPADSCNSSGNLPDCRWGVGWASYDAVGGTATPYELFPSTPVTDLVDGGALSLVANSLNSSVLGRYRFAMIGGVTQGFTAPSMGGGVTTGPVIPAAGGNQLADTGTASAPLGLVAGGFVLVGAAVVGIGAMARRRP